MNLKKSFLALALALMLCLGLVVATPAEEAEFGAATSMQTGEYILVVSGIEPTGMSRGNYYITAEEAKNPGLLFAAYDEDDVDGATYWKVTRVSDTECTIQNPEKGDNGYLNMSANTLKYGKKQNLKYQWAAGQCKFYVTVGGTNYYIRFTNSTNNESRFHAGTGDGSNLFKLYGMVTPEKEPDLPTNSDADQPLPKGDPLLTVACVSDLHADYGLQGQKPYVRNSVIETLNRISKEENADIVLVGGDNTSDNGRVSDQGGWAPDIFQSVIDTYTTIFDEATESGRSLWACGNHDSEAGEDEGYDSYAAYEEIMKSCGEPLSVYRQKDDKTVSDQRYPEHIMGIHYNVEGFDFIVINPPYAQALNYSTGLYQWLSWRLAGIADTRTVFVLSHYPFTDGRGISTPTYGLSGGAYTALTGILKKYPNVIYLYGHNHGNAESVYISEDTFERINSYTADGGVVNNRNVIPTSFITSFMGSMSYYNYYLNPGGLAAEDPEIVQALMIYVYADRVVFQMKNYGEHPDHADKVLKPWTVMRDVKGSLDDANPEVQKDQFFTGANGSGSGNDGNGGDSGNSGGVGNRLPYVPPVMGDVLVTEGVNDAVVYDPALSIRKTDLAKGAVTLKIDENSSISGADLREGMEVILRPVTSGPNYSILTYGLKKAVNEFNGYEIIIKENGEDFRPSGMVKITLPIPEDFADRAKDITFGAYYVQNTNPYMTDVELSKDGKTVTFLLPELRPFAISARSIVPYDLENPSPALGGTLEIVLAVSGGVIAVGGIVVLILVLRKMWKKDRETPYQS